MTLFFNAANSLASDPGDPLGRVAMLTALEDSATAFRNTAEALARVSEAVAQSADGEVSALNDALAALRDLNGSIRAAARGGSARASLEDERDRLIDHRRADRHQREDRSGRHRRDHCARRRQRHPAVRRWRRPCSAPRGARRPHLAADFDQRHHHSRADRQGRLAGLVDVAATTADKRAALDALAADFVATVNDWNGAGLDANGNPGADLLEAPAGAASMRRWSATPIWSPPASTDGRANGNLLALDAVRDASGVEDRWAEIVSRHAQIARLGQGRSRGLRRLARHQPCGARRSDRRRSRHEAAELLRYQQAYNASARIIQVAREAIQALFDAL